MDITELSLGTQSRRPNWLYMLKFVFTVSINLTLAVFFILLAPKMDPDYLVSAGNLTVHFLTPVIAAAHFLLFDIEYEVRRSHCVLCAVPPLCYFAFTMLLSLNGVTFGPESTVPYFFLNYELLGWFGFSKNGPGVFWWLIIILALIVGNGLFLSGCAQ
jgi:hypothetical protein